MTELTPQEKAVIEQEAIEKYPMPGPDATNVTNFTTGFVVAKRAAYLAAALPRELLLKQERERVKGLEKCLIEINKSMPVGSWFEKTITKALTQYKAK